MPVPPNGSPPLTRSRTLEHLGRIGSSDSGLLLEGSETSLTPARSLLRQMHQVYPKGAADMGRAPPASGSEPARAALPPSGGKLDRRKRFRKLEQNATTRHNNVTASEMGAGRFDAIDDEVVVEIMHLLVTLPRYPGPGLEVHDSVRKGARDLLSLLLTCFFQICFCCDFLFFKFHFQKTIGLTLLGNIGLSFETFCFFLEVC